MHAIAATMRNTAAVVATIAELVLSAFPALAVAMDSDYDVDLCAGTGQHRVGVEVQWDAGD